MQLECHCSQALLVDKLRNICMIMHIYLHMCVCTHAHVCLHKRVNAHTYVCRHTFIYQFLFLSVYSQNHKLKPIISSSNPIPPPYLQLSS